jgi:hypothetical protein
MTVLLARVRPSLLCLSILLLALPASAQEDLPEPLVVRAEVKTVVTGAERSIAWPDGPAGMTPQWLVARVSIDWLCRSGKPIRLEVKHDGGPKEVASHKVDLRPRPEVHYGTLELELYLWEQSAVKAACAKDGEVRVESAPVLVTLHCANSRVYEWTQKLPLQVRCRPSEPSQAAVTGLSGSEWGRGDSPETMVSLSKFVHEAPDPERNVLTVGKRVKVPLGDLRGVMPAIRTLRVVRLDEAGAIVERFPPTPLKGKGTFEERYEPQLTLAPKQVGTLRFAYEAEYFDGSKLLSKAATIEVEKPRKLRKTGPLTAEQRHSVMQALEKKMATADCGPELVKWLREQPYVQDAGGKGSNLWLNFTDGLPMIITCRTTVR